MSWRNLLKLLEDINTLAQKDDAGSISRLEAKIVELGHISRTLREAEPPDGATILMIHAAVNRLQIALPAEKNTIREKIAGLVTRSQAWQAYNRNSTTSIKS